MKLFSRRKKTINAIQIPHFNWTPEVSTSTQKLWRNKRNAIELSIHFSASPAIHQSLKSIEDQRQHFRKNLQTDEMGLILLDVCEVKTYKAVKTITKHKDDTPGIEYVGSLNIPFQTCAFIIKLAATEIGVTGMRESIVANKLMSKNELSIDENGFKNWIQDPYAPFLKDGLLMNKSEAEIYDPQFPTHPLSLVRHYLKEIEKEMKISRTLEQGPLF